jgi:uncharacterized membrane protein
MVLVAGASRPHDVWLVAEGAVWRIVWLSSGVLRKVDQNYVYASFCLGNELPLLV